MPALNSFSTISSDSTADSDLIFLHDISATQSNATRSMQFSTVTEKVFSVKSTTDLSEGTNLYYTQARVDSDIDAALGNTLVTFGSTNEKVTQLDSANGTVTHNISLSSIFNHKNIASDFKPNFTNVPLTNDRALSPAIILNQGATAYMINGVNINGDSQTINWLGGSAPTGTSNGIDVIGVTLIRDSDTWSVIASGNSYS